MIYKSILSIIFALFVIVSCKTNESDRHKSKPLAMVNDYYLYKENIYIPENIIDTNGFVKSFVDNWVQDKLIYKEAKKNLPNTTKNEFSNLIEEYKNQLYVNAYKELYIKQKLDTVVSNSEIEKYYNINIGRYKLSDIIIKAIYIKIPRNAPKVYKVRNWLKSNKTIDTEKLNTYCAQYSDKFDDFQGAWILFDDVFKFFPRKVSKPSSVLKYKSLFETRDSTYIYYIDVDEYKLKNDTTPVVFVKNEIIDDIIKQRKKDLIKTMKLNLYEDAKNKNEIVYYN